MFKSGLVKVGTLCIILLISATKASPLTLASPHIALIGISGFRESHRNSNKNACLGSSAEEVAGTLLYFSPFLAIFFKGLTAY